MAARVLLNSSGLRVSNPGYDVLSATVQDMGFDSQYPMMGTMVTGTGYCNALISNPNTQSNHGTTLFYPNPVVGKTPICIVQWYTDPTDEYPRGGGFQWRWLRYGSNPPIGNPDAPLEDPGGGGTGRPVYDYPYDYSTSDTWGIEYRAQYDRITVLNYNSVPIYFRYVSFYTAGNY